MEEVWKDIKGYEGLYQVSNLGRVRNKQRKYLKEIKIYKVFENKRWLFICRLKKRW
jgi:hypothetical protein